jgi:uncharacterized protein involved in outer membrane biogenesis
MALSRKSRIWITIAAFPVLLIILAVIAAKIYFTGERLRSMVIPRIEAATHRTVAISDISLSVFPSIAVSIDSLKISNPHGGAFRSPEFISLANCEIRVKLIPLLTGNMEIR